MINRNLSDNFQVADKLFRMPCIKRIVIIEPYDIHQVVARIAFEVSGGIFNPSCSLSIKISRKTA